MRSSRTADVSTPAVVAALSLVFISYEVARALRVSITFDEAATFLVYIKGGFLALFNFNEANNHFLNTLLAKIFTLIGGNHDFVLRLPNLLGYAMYLAFAWLLLKRFVRGTAAVLGFVLLNTNPYVLDFFSLCRGYGLSLAFLMASLYFFTRFLSRSSEQGSEVDRLRSLTRGLGMAGVAVLCNFALLDVYCSLLVVAALVLILGRGKARDGLQIDPAGPSRFPGRKAVVGLIFLAAVFNMLAISQDLELSDSLFEPVKIRIPGLALADAGRIVVNGLDEKKAEIPSLFKNDEWTIGGKTEFVAGLHFEIPADALHAVQGLEIHIGSRTFPITGQDLRARLHGRKNLIFDGDEMTSLKRSILPLFKPAINWKGDANHLRLIALRFMLLAAVFALAVLLAYGAGRFCVRLKILGREAYWRLAVPTLVLGGFIAYPLFLLKEEGSLYWGGNQGLIHDTWTTLVDSSFYGTLYLSRQNLWVGLFSIVLIVLFASAMAVHARKKTLATHLPEALIPAVIALAVLSVILQHVLFGNPFLIGRTALFFIPLSALFLVISLSFFGKLGRAAKCVSLSLLTVVALFSAYHFFRTANTAITVEWRFNADTKQVISDLEHLRNERDPRPQTIQLGVDWIFYPPFVYYQRQADLAWLDVRSYAEREKNDVYYLERAFNPDRMVLIKSYPATGNILVRLKNEE
jgi:hypothetical protein